MEASEKLLDGTVAGDIVWESSIPSHTDQEVTKTTVRGMTFYLDRDGAYGHYLLSGVPQYGRGSVLEKADLTADTPLSRLWAAVVSGMAERRRQEAAAADVAVRRAAEEALS